jgi:hypothetical protein
MSSNQQSGSSSSNNSNGGQQTTAYVGEKPYTAEEKAYLKEQFGGEYRMLREQGLSIYKESDREEGRAIMRAFMEQDKQSEGK